MSTTINQMVLLEEPSWTDSVVNAWDITTTFASDCANQIVDTLSPCASRMKTLHPLLWIVLLWDFYVVSKIVFNRIHGLKMKHTFAPAVIFGPIVGLLAIHAVQKDPVYILLLGIFGMLMHIPFTSRSRKRKRDTPTGPPRRSERLRQKRENANN